MSSHIEAELEGRGGTDVRFARGRAGRSEGSLLLRSRSCVVTSALSHEGATITFGRHFWPSGFGKALVSETPSVCTGRLPGLHPSAALRLSFG